MFINLPSITDKMYDVLENFESAFKVITSFTYTLKCFVKQCYKSNLLCCVNYTNWTKNKEKEIGPLDLMPK